MFNSKLIFIAFFLLSPSILMASTGTIINVIDGDSVIIKVDGKQFPADLIFVDAPEIGEQFGKEAKKYVVENTKGKALNITDHGTIFSNNHLIEIFLSSGVSINKLLIENGYAKYLPSIKASAQLETLEQKAKSRKIGIWGLDYKKSEIIYSDDREEVLAHEGKAYYITKDKKYITKSQLKELIAKEKNQSKASADKQKDSNKKTSGNDGEEELSPCKAQCRSTFPYNNMARAACMSLCLY